MSANRRAETPDAAGAGAPTGAVVSGAGIEPTVSGAGIEPTASGVGTDAAASGRVVLLDVDGTLVDYQTNLPTSAADAVRLARANGHRIYLCTGRAKAEIYDHLWELGIDGLIGGNGSYVESRGEVIRHQVLDAATVTEAVDWLLEQGLEFYLECNHALYGTDGLFAAVAAIQGESSEEAVEKARSAMPHLVLGEIAGAGPDAAWRTDCNKISFVLRDDIDLAALGERFAGRAAVGSWTLTGQREDFGEIGQIGVHKGVAVELLGEHLGVPVSEFIAFGDSRSDLELLQTCGTSVAMGQAPDAVKAVATMVTDPVDADGLAHGFEKLGLLA